MYIVIMLLIPACLILKEKAQGMGLLWAIPIRTSEFFGTSSGVFGNLRKLLDYLRKF